MTTKNKCWTHKGFGSGFGDLINHVSYEMRSATEPITINWQLQGSANRQVYRILNFLRPNKLIEHKFNACVVDNSPPLPQRVHDYWENKELHEGGDYICIQLYVEHRSGHHQNKVVRRFEVESLIRSLKANGNKVFILPNVGDLFGKSLYNINYDFLQYTAMMTSALKNCKYFICSEGGLAHFARTMKVPSLVYFLDGTDWRKKGHPFDLKDFWTTKHSKPIHDLAGVAQLAEQLICNQQVAGSSPIASSRA